MAGMLPPAFATSRPTTGPRLIWLSPITKIEPSSSPPRIAMNAGP